jgi:hypothetical protein
VVAAAALRRWAWPAAATVAAAPVAALALHGHRPEPGVVRFEAAGLMREPAPERAREILVTAGARRWRFVRDEDGAWTERGAAGAEGWARRVDKGLRFLHASAPMRTLAPAEVEGIADREYGLDPPRYTVSVRGPAGAPFVVAFGGVNAQGLGQYARVDGRGEVFLLPRYVGGEWEAAAGLR